MRRFWKRKDEVQPFHAPPSEPQSPAAAAPQRAGLFLGDYSRAHAAGGGSGWIGREIDGSPNISRPLGAIMRRTAPGPLHIQTQLPLDAPATPPSSSPLSPSAFTSSAALAGSPKLRFYKTAASSPSSTIPISSSSLSHLQRSTSESSSSPPPSSSSHVVLPRSASERTGLKPAVPVPVVPVSAAPKSISLLCGTWNMHGKPPPPFFPGFADSDAIHDIYCFGTQEAGNGIVMSFVKPSKEEWEARLRSTLGPFYVMIASKTMQAIHIVVFARAPLARCISNVKVARVPTGLLGFIGNKGGVAVSFQLNEKSILFVSAHFAAHQEQVHKRNADAAQIEEKLSHLLQAAPDDDLFDDVGEHARPVGADVKVAWRHRGDRQASDAYDYTFFMGDLNYRIDMSRCDVLHQLSSGNLADLQASDQLHQQRLSGNVLRGFSEGRIEFPPTYKFDKNSDSYDTSSKARTPSWTDRVLFKSKHPLTLKLNRYESLRDIRTSDHRPVVALFDIML